MKAIIAGAGIGGLTAALCLHRIGFEVEIYESARTLRPLGVGINLLPHGAAILHGLGLGGPLDAIGIATRASFANQAVDAGAKTCLWWPDQTTADFIEARDGSRPDPANWDLPDEPDRVGMERFDLELLEPLLARPGDPSDVVPVREAAGEAIHQAVIGSCAGGRIEDLREAAGVLAGRHIAAGVRLVVTPASQRVYLGAVREGLIEVMVAAGAIVTASSCAACGGIDKGLLGAAEVGISTSNRNFAGRMGHRDARIYLASARTVAASAVAGRVVDPREVLS